MLGLGLGEITLLFAVLLVVVGPERIPQVLSWAGRAYGKLRRASDELRRAFVVEADRVDAEERQHRLKERRARAEEARKRALASAGQGAVAQHRLSDARGAELPEGVSREDWAGLPENVKRALMGERAKAQAESPPPETSPPTDTAASQKTETATAPVADKPAASDKTDAPTASGGSSLE